MTEILKTKLLILPVFLALLFLGCNSQDIPAVDQPSTLVTDCSTLMTGDSQESIDRAGWPESIRQLNPIYVQRGTNYIMITTYAETGVGARGYIISKDSAITIPRYKITETSNPGIYRFDYRP